MGAKDILAGFDDLKQTPAGEDVHYPGSKQVRRAVAQPADPWDDVPCLKLTVRGELTKLYTVGVLADMLGRKAQAIRKWERLGYIPTSRYRSPSKKTNGQKRLYTREQIEGIVAIAKEEGIIGAETSRNVSSTAFPEKVRKLFEVKR